MLLSLPCLPVPVWPSTVSVAVAAALGAVVCCHVSFFLLLQAMAEH